MGGHDGPPPRDRRSARIREPLPGVQDGPVHHWGSHERRALLPDDPDRHAARPLAGDSPHEPPPDGCLGGWLVGGHGLHARRLPVGRRSGAALVADHAHGRSVDALRHLRRALLRREPHQQAEAELPERTRDRHHAAWHVPEGQGPQHDRPRHHDRHPARRMGKSGRSSTARHGLDLRYRDHGMGDAHGARVPLHRTEPPRGRPDPEVVPRIHAVHRRRHDLQRRPRRHDLQLLLQERQR